MSVHPDDVAAWKKSLTAAIPAFMLESQLAASNLFQALENQTEIATALARELVALRTKVARLEETAATRGKLAGDLAAQMQSFADRCKSPEEPAIDIAAAETVFVQALGLPASLVPQSLRLVKPGRCPSCGATIGDRHSFDCKVRMDQHTGGRPEGA